MSKIDGPKVKFTISEERIDHLLGVLATILALNVVLSVKLDVRVFGFKLVPMWIVLISLCHVSKGNALFGVLVAGILCFASEYVCYLEKDAAVKWEKIPPVIICDFLLLIPICLIAATRLDNASSEREKEYLSFRRRMDERAHLKKTIEHAHGEMKKKGREATQQPRDKSLEGRKAILHFTLLGYGEIFHMRFRRDVPKVVENLFLRTMGISRGVVFEVPEDSKDLRLRNHWGVEELRPGNVIALISEHKGAAFLRWVVDRKQVLTPADAQTDMSMLDGYNAFSKGLFEVRYALPIVVLQRTAFVLVLSAPDDKTKVPFEIKQVESIMDSIGACLVKIGSKDKRPKFSTFNPTAD